MDRGAEPTVMTWDELRAACLSYDGAHETFPFTPGVSVFKAANGKMFALGAATGEPLGVSVKCDPERGVALRRQYAGITEGYHLNKRHWVTVSLEADVPGALVRELVEDSYDLVSGPVRGRRR